ncbi:replication initiator [Nocardia nova]|uniref:replication initiator n=1 Tax=Nocardia nova TaxID=37330 RepID=UPI003C7D5F5A
MHAALCRTPCSPRCAIWLLYGLIPKGATAKTVPGVCKARAHRRETLALPGNRVLTSEKWTGKTLGDHKADRIEFVRRKLAAVGIDEAARDPRRYTWATVALGTRMPSRAQLLMSAIAERVASVAPSGPPQSIGAALRHHRPNLGRADRTVSSGTGRWCHIPVRAAARLRSRGLNASWREASDEARTNAARACDRHEECRRKGGVPSRSVAMFI